MDEEVNGQEFDISKLPPQEHRWLQEGNQPTLKCTFNGHNHTAAIPQGVHAMPDEKGNLTLVRMG